MASPQRASYMERKVNFMLNCLQKFLSPSLTYLDISHRQRNQRTSQEEPHQAETRFWALATFTFRPPPDGCIAFWSKEAQGIIILNLMRMNVKRAAECNEQHFVKCLTPLPLSPSFPLLALFA